MGANAQTAVPVFTAGQVLTAVQQTEINTGIPVFATTVTRDAAFGGAGKKTLAEGQFAYIEATNTTQYYDGANWQAVGTTPGLVCVKAETAVSAVTSATADNVFTSSYTNYLILFEFLTSTSNALSIKFRAGGVSTSTNYNKEEFYAAGAASAASQLTGQTSFTIGSTNGFKSLQTIQLYSPQIADTTLLTTYGSNNFGNYTTGVSTLTQTGNQNSSTQFDGIEFLVGSGTFTAKYAIYGYSKTV